MADDLPTIERVEGYDGICSRLQWKALVTGISTTDADDILVFCGEQQSEPGGDDLIGSIDLLFENYNVKEKTKLLLEALLHETKGHPFLAQVWAPKEVGEELLLRTSDQYFAFGSRRYGLALYRNHCATHYYRVDDGADEEMLGAVGRVYRSKHPESTPDLRLYSSKEFPLRDFAARCGLKLQYTLPYFDPGKKVCHGVIEVSSFEPVDVVHNLLRALNEQNLRSTHLKLISTPPWDREVDSEITKMLEVAVTVMPQLQMAQVWVPCRECSLTRSESGCMEIAKSFRDPEKEDIHNYLLPCHLHHLQRGKHSNMVTALTRSTKKSCISRNICNISISDYPLAHHAQKARLSLCFAIRLQRLENDKEFYVVEFFLQPHSREDPFAGSFLPLLVRIMEANLRSFDFPYKGQRRGQYIAVEVFRGTMLGSDESSQSGAQENIQYKNESSQKFNKLMVMDGWDKSCLIKDFLKCFEDADLPVTRMQTLESSRHGWVFLLKDNEREESIQVLMSEISKYICDSYSLVQFWAHKSEGDRLFLDTSGQPFAVGCLNKGLAHFRVKSMGHKYYVDEAAKEQDLGPPGRVFQNRHPEITPDLRLYSLTEFPLRNHAAHSRLRSYLALPVFRPNKQECFGVLELVGFSNSRLQEIENALRVANLISSTHINFQSSFPGSSADARYRKWDLADLENAGKLFTEIPQVHKVAVWFDNSECRYKTNRIRCIERIWASRSMGEPKLCKIQHVEAGKGITGMALISENTAYFCRNVCEFTRVEQPLAHHAQRAGLDSVFAICLRNFYTDTLYVLEFYLNHGPKKYENLRSFLRLVLPIMHKELKHFRVAPNQPLAQKLVVEVIEFSEVNDTEIEQPETESRFTLNFVKSRVPVQFDTDSPGTTSAKRKKDVTVDEVKAQFGKNMMIAKGVLQIGLKRLQKITRQIGPKRWPGTPKQAEKFFQGQDSGQNLGQSSRSKVPIPLSLTYTDPGSPKGGVSIKVQVQQQQHNHRVIIIDLSSPARLEELSNKVAGKFQLAEGTFQLTYLDEVNDEILLIDDEDLHRYLKSNAEVARRNIQVVPQGPPSRFLRSPSVQVEPPREDTTMANYKRFLLTNEYRNIGSRYGQVGPDFFKRIENLNNDLDDEQINAYLSILNRSPFLADVQVHHELLGRFAIVDTWFFTKVQQMWNALHGGDARYDPNTMEELPPGKELETLIQYVHGEKPRWETATRWSMANEVLMVCHLTNHWVVSKVDLRECMYDSFRHHFSDPDLKRRSSIFLPLQRIIPALLHKAGFWDERPDLKSQSAQWHLTFSGVAENFIQKDSHSCGPLALKMVENLLSRTGTAGGADANMVRQFRQRMALTMYRYSKDGSTWERSFPFD